MAKRKKSKSKIKEKQLDSRIVKEYGEQIKEARQVLSKVKKKGLTESIIRQEGRIKTLETKKEKAKKIDKTTRKFKSKAEKLIVTELKSFKKPFLKKPKAEGPTPISAKKTLSRFAQSSGPLVREVERPEVVQDNRSQFFKDEFIKEKRSESKWLS